MTRFSLSARFVAALAMVAGVHLVSSQFVEAARPITKTKFDPDARQVEMFEAMESGEIKTNPIAKNSLGGNLLITNETDEPLTVKLPQGFVVAPLAQIGGFGGGGIGGGGLGGGQQGGGQQAAGGGAGQQGGIGGGQGAGGGGFFSIPPKKTLSVPYTSVCLQHGLDEPHPRSNYVVIPSEKFSDDPALLTLIDMVGTGKVNPAAAQAAAWHLSDGMSWQQLAAKRYKRVAAPDTPYFSHAQLMGAQQVVATAKQLAEKGGLSPENQELQQPSRVRAER